MCPDAETLATQVLFWFLVSDSCQRKDPDQEMFDGRYVSYGIGFGDRWTWVSFMDLLYGS